ncbi:MAG: outer membrane protein assembly factor BamE [Gammaproteobacteria bacterium]
MKLKLILPFFLGIALTTGCSFPEMYKVVISQGNLVDQEMIDKLEVGMTESQVKFVMGTPLITDTFYPNRWDYFTSVTQGETTYTNQKITLLFEENKLVSWEGKMESGS